VAAADLESKTALVIKGQITWLDADGDPERVSTLHGGTWTVTGGRLGRDHTLEDVPHNHVRDRVMDYINEMIPPQKQQSVRRAVFTDLSDADIDTYSSLVKAMSYQDDSESSMSAPSRNKRSASDLRQAPKKNTRKAPAKGKGTNRSSDQSNERSTTKEAKPSSHANSTTGQPPQPTEVTRVLRKRKDLHGESGQGAEGQTGVNAKRRTGTKSCAK
jgi:hypothetical protein